jgi:hypothetical protein
LTLPLAETLPRSAPLSVRATLPALSRTLAATTLALAGRSAGTALANFFDANAEVVNPRLYPLGR